ncbi:uncharacterized protein LOC125769530 [Anopheles funestus]|uniref:uncharacterized protein LOC125769530 n=1 Tax=Anopheles funestus TaxID=62324 RepID=UPI0020C64E93|nr:uncharacterized protein LOC125769530 [Anopheles funestus]
MRQEEERREKEVFEERMKEMRRQLEERKARHDQELQLLKELHALQMKCDAEKKEQEEMFKQERTRLLHPHQQDDEQKSIPLNCEETQALLEGGDTAVSTKTEQTIVPAGDGSGQSLSRLTKEQIATRKSISTKLPKFAGEAEVWPLFISSYTHTNEACGFTNLENLQRLQECLHGEALEAVRGRLLMPHSVPGVIAELKRRYGNPKRLLKMLLRKIRATEPPREKRLVTFVEFGTKVQQLCDHVEECGLTEHISNPLLVDELVNKLPLQYQREWSRFEREQNDSSLLGFSRYISGLVDDISDVMERLEDDRNPTQEKKRVNVHATETSSTQRSESCWNCGEQTHRLKNCGSFKQMPLSEKMKRIKNLQLCETCLARGCNGKCAYKVRCARCKGRHHTLLHRSEESLHTSSTAEDVVVKRDTVVVFRMIPVTLYYGSMTLDVMAFIDEGSSVTLLDDSAARHLNVSGVPEPLVISWTNDINRHENESRLVQLMISERGSGQKYELINTRTVSELKLPMPYVTIADLKCKYAHLTDISAKEYLPQRPMIILGLDNVHLFAPIESRLGNVGEPIAVRSLLGWSIFGTERCSRMFSAYLNLHTASQMSNEMLHDLIKEQYRLEDLDKTTHTMPEAADEQRARTLLESTTCRVGDRFETGLLWKNDVRQFPDSYPMAEKRMQSLERKLNRQPQLKEVVLQQMEDYQQKGYAHKINPNEMLVPGNSVWYIPLNVVQNPKKPGKVRLVWDAAASVKGVSLNSELLKGPDMLIPLPNIINNFREKAIAFGADIKEMYHQIRIRDADKQAQRFLFGYDSSGRPQVYVMDVATFGATCSPSSAQYIKNLNAAQHQHEYPEAAEAIIKRHYVDDYFDCTDTVEEAVSLAEQVKYVHSKGGFHIRNWVSNSTEVLSALKEDNAEDRIRFKGENTASTERVLGISWLANEDVFCLNSENNDNALLTDLQESQPSKRKVLSFIMGHFDPMGFFAPITVRGKMLMQDIWRTGCNWDEPIEATCYERWCQMIQNMQNVGLLKIPRSYFGKALSSEIKDVQLHVFTDASETAFGCVAYFRAVVQGEVRCSLVMSRTKVAPLKKISIPRLELLGAVLGARMAKTIRDNHKLAIDRVVIWTDAKVVLSWIRSDHRRYKQFVGFRVGEILDLTNISDWRWIPSKMNIADILTKWGKAPDIGPDSDWVCGPKFLRADECCWPVQELPPANTTEELRAHLFIHNVELLKGFIDVRRFSKWTVLVRTVACVYRFIANCIKKAKGEPIETLRATVNQQKILMAVGLTTKRTPLQQPEYAKAEMVLIRTAQAESFIDEWKTLMKNKESSSNQWIGLERSSPLFRLSPFIDEKDLIRMEGRTEYAESLPYNMRFPIILPSDHYITGLIIQHYHERYGHGYRETVKNELRQHYYIPHLDAAVRRETAKCMWCKVRRNQPTTPRMAPLPPQRLTPNVRPFSYTGVDYIGPYEVSIGRRTEKRWIVLFTCLVVRGIHLEIAHSLSTMSCMMALRRFICRRGWPIEFVSDNGTNFKGASREIVGALRDIEEECADQLTNARTRWTFNPPVAPHMGGVWERLDVVKMG